jgi:hypothetical protein
MSGRRTSVSDEDEATLWALALVEGTSVAEQKRRAICAYTERARRDESLAALVQSNVEQKQRREREKAINVIPLRRRAR